MKRMSKMLAGVPVAFLVAFMLFGTPAAPGTIILPDSVGDMACAEPADCAMAATALSGVGVALATTDGQQRVTAYRRSATKSSRSMKECRPCPAGSLLA